MYTHADREGGGASGGVYRPPCKIQSSLIYKITQNMTWSPNWKSQITVGLFPPPPEFIFFYPRMTLLYVNNLQINLFVYLA